MNEQQHTFPVIHKLLAFLLALALAITLLPGGVIWTLEVNAATTTHDISTGSLTITATNSGTDYIITQADPSTATTNYIIVNPGYEGTITLRGVNIQNSGDYPPIWLQSTSTVTNELSNIDIDTNVTDGKGGCKVDLILDGTNTLINTDAAIPALEIDQGSQVTINAIDATDNTSGSLEAQSYTYAIGDLVSGSTSAGGAPAIGAPSNNSNPNGNGVQGSASVFLSTGASNGTGNTAGGNILIGSGTVTAAGSYHGAGIGGGWSNYYNGTILIYGGVVTSRGGGHSSGIGTGCAAGSGNDGRYANDSRIIVLPPASITATTLQTGEKGLAGGASIVYIGDPEQPAVAIRVDSGGANYVQDANIYADLSNIEAVNGAIEDLIGDTSILDPQRVKLGKTDNNILGYDAHLFNANLASPVTFFTDETTPNNLNYLSVTATVLTGSPSFSSPDHIFTLQTPYMPDTDTGLVASQNLTVSYIAADAENKAASLTLENSGDIATGSYADLKLTDTQNNISGNLELIFANDAASSFVADPIITFTDASAIRGGTIPATLSELIRSGYIYKGEKFTITFPIVEGKPAGVYNSTFTLKGQSEAQRSSVTLPFDIAQTVADYGVTSVTANPPQLGEDGGTTIITIEGTELLQAIADGLYLEWTTDSDSYGSGSVTGKIDIDTGDFTTARGVISVTVRTPTDTKIELVVELDEQQWYHSLRDDEYTFEPYVKNTQTGTGFVRTNVTTMVCVGESVPQYTGISVTSQNPIPLGDTKPGGGPATIQITGHYLYNFDSITLYDEINGKTYDVYPNKPADDRTVTYQVAVPSVEGAYPFKLTIMEGSELVADPDKEVAYVAVGGAAVPTVDTYEAPGSLNDPGPTDPSDKEWTGRGVGHKGGGFTGDYAGFDFLYHHCKQEVLKNPDNAVVTLQNIWYVTQTQLDYASLGAHEASNWRGGKVELRFDTTDTDNTTRLEGRLIIDPFEAKADLYPVVCTCLSETAKTRSLFANRYGTSKLAAVCLTQNGAYGTRVEILANVDLSGMDADSLYLYQYDRETGEFARMAKADYSVDADGFLHFFTENGGDVIITDSPLTQNGTAVTTGSFPVDRKEEEKE